MSKYTNIGILVFSLMLCVSAHATEIRQEAPISTVLTQQEMPTDSFDTYLSETAQDQVFAQPITVQKPSFIQRQLIRFGLPLYFGYLACKKYVKDMWHTWTGSGK
jgi:hypothetical protein